MLKKLFKRIDQRFSIYTLCKVICVLLILFLLIKTQVVWGSWAGILRSVMQPFVIGFVLAYVMHPLVEFLEKKGISKNFSIIALWVCVLVFLIVMLVMLMPVLYDKINEFMTSMIDGVVWISNKIKTLGNMKDFSLVNSITNNIVNMLQSYDDWVPQLVSSLPGLMNTVLNMVTNILFSIIIAIYMLFDFDRIKLGLRKFIHLFFKNSDVYLHEIDQNVTVYLKSLIILMQLVSSLPGLMNTVLNMVTNILFSIIIAIYMLFDFDRIKLGLRKFIHLFFKNSDVYLHEIDQNVTVYLKSLIILMLIKFVEYSAFYFMIGHQDWLIIGLLTSFGVIIPYLGGTIANSIGIITALTLPPSNIVALIIGIMILSNVDAYVISPLVHEKRSAMGPLVTLFAVFAGGVISGAVGIMVSVPAAIAIKTMMEVYEKRNDRKLYGNAVEADDEVVQ